MKLGQTACCPSQEVRQFGETLECSLDYFSSDASAQELAYFPGVEIFFPVSGELILDYPKQNLSLGPGQLILMSGLHHFQFAQQQPVDYYRLRLSLLAFFSLKLPASYKSRILHGVPLPLDQKYYCQASLLPRWREDLQAEDPGLTELVLDELCLLLRRNLGPHLSVTDHASDLCFSLNQHVLKALDFIQLNYTSPIGVPDVAEAVSLNKKFLMGQFKKALGITVLDYLTLRRIGHAQRLLLYGDDQVAQIAFACGFASVTRFYEVFSRHFGISPMQYRKRHACYA